MRHTSGNSEGWDHPAVSDEVRKVAIYARMSEDIPGNQAGVTRQIEDCRQLAQRHGWRVVAEFVDNDMSAWSRRERPEFSRLLTSIRAGLISAVVVWHTDRLTRRIRELVDYVEAVESANVSTITVTAGPLDLTTAAGRMQVHLLGTLAEYESSHRSERVARAMQQGAEKGAFHGGRRCFGYEKDGITIRVDEAVVIRHIIEAIVAGESLRSIVSGLNRSGKTTATGKSWTSTAVRALAKSPRLAGIRVHRGLEYPAAWPAIVDETEWRIAVAILNSDERRTNNRGNAVQYLGSGLYVCGVCQSTDVRVSVVDGRKRYRCRNRVKGDPKTHVGRDQRLLDEFVENAVLEHLPKINMSDPTQPSPRTNIQDLMKVQETLQRRQDTLAELYAEGTISHSQLVAGTSRITREFEQIESLLSTADIVSIIEGMRSAGRGAEIWSTLDIIRRREILRWLVTVTILPVPSGRNRQGRYFRSEGVHFHWHSEG